MVSKTEVELAYRLLLGREPESRSVVDAVCKSHDSLQDLRRRFMSSPEFFAQLDRHRLSAMPLSWPPSRVEVELDAGRLQELITRIEREFVYLAETEPFWSVISQDRFRVANIKGSEPAFFRSGKGVVDDFRVTAARYGIELNTFGICVELGCGLGRSTIFLSEEFERVLALDISAAHLQLARGFVNEHGKHNVEFLHVNTLATFENVPEFDAFFSIIVLQHNPPPLIAYLLKLVLRKLRSNGLAYFQIPTYKLNYEFVLDTYLAREQPRGIPEVHALPQRDLFRIVQNAKCEVLEIREDDAAGPQAVSNRILVRKT
jgi:SAM-dependent methyltransferase